MRLNVALALGIAVAAGCDSANFNSGLASRGKATDEDQPSSGDDGKDDGSDGEDKASGVGVDDAEDQDFKEVDLGDTGDEGGAISIYVGENGVYQEVFAFGEEASTPLVDFVFVIDNSVSMGGLLDKTAAGFRSIADDNAFPQKTKIAVMTTMVGDPDDLSKTHKNISAYQGIQHEPGFLDFVDDEAIQAFKNNPQVPAGKKAAYTMDGCEKWFSPGQKNASGDYCMVAHAQSPLHGVGCEAGINAVGQLLEKHKGKRLFRRGAVVNFVFVSDTHDPGCGAKKLIDSRPSLEDLKAALERDNTIAGLVFHAIAPVNSCTGESVHDRSYFPLVEATKGHKEDSCSAKDYSEAARKVVDVSTTMTKPIFALSKEAQDVLMVKVDGKQVQDWTTRTAARSRSLACRPTPSTKSSSFTRPSNETVSLATRRKDAACAML